MSPTLMMTAAHVVANAASVSVQIGGSTVNASVLGLDDGLDVALIRLSAPVSGHVFALASTLPAVGTEVATLGFPLDAGLTVTKGIISAVERTERSEVGVKSHLIQTDTSFNFGNSGGPLITVDGTVVGIVSLKGGVGPRNQPVQGMNFAASIVTGWTATSSWRDGSQAAPVVSCAKLQPGSNNLPAVYVFAPQPEASNVAAVLYAHGDAINRSNYSLAFSLLSTRLKSTSGDVGTWSSGLKSSYWVALAVDNVVRSGPTLSTDVRLRTTQLPEDGPNNQTCSQWTIRYGMVLEGGIWRIDSAKTPWGPPQPC